jgi:hypothetical protein
MATWLEEERAAREAQRVKEGCTSARARRRYSTVVAIEAIPVPGLDRYTDIRERLSCGHLGANHGGTWEGTAAPLRRHPSQYMFLIGRRRQCHTCSATPPIEQSPGASEPPAPQGDTTR